MLYLFTFLLDKYLHKRILYASYIEFLRKFIILLKFEAFRFYV